MSLKNRRSTLRYYCSVCCDGFMATELWRPYLVQEDDVGEKAGDNCQEEERRFSRVGSPQLYFYRAMH